MVGMKYFEVKEGLRKFGAEVLRQEVRYCKVRYVGSVRYVTIPHREFNIKDGLPFHC